MDELTRELMVGVSASIETLLSQHFARPSEDSPYERLEKFRTLVAGILKISNVYEFVPREYHLHLELDAEAQPKVSWQKR